MDRYEGPARLEWWANSSTCLGYKEIDLSVQVEGVDWRAGAAYRELPKATDREAWSWLLELSPYVELVLPGPDRAHIEVRVEEAADGHVTLSTP